MSKSQAPHGATTIRAKRSGGGMWLLGAAAAMFLAGGGYLVWKNYAQPRDGAAYTESYATDPDDSGAAAPIESSAGDAAASDINAAAPASARSSAPRAEPVPEATIGVTPINAALENRFTDNQAIVVTAARRPIWARTPSARRLSAMYPERALERGREGEARLHCIVQDGGALDCEKRSETPGGFGNAALRVARTFRHAPALADGSDATGSPVNLRVVFRIDDSQRRT